MMCVGGQFCPDGLERVDGLHHGLLGLNQALFF